MVSGSVFTLYLHQDKPEKILLIILPEGIIFLSLYNVFKFKVYPVSNLFMR